MKSSFINTEHIEGYLYEHDLSVKTVQNPQSDNYGKDYISGTIDVVTDEEGLNVLTVNFTYVTEYTKAQKVNRTYGVLKRIIDEGKTWVADGKDAATKLKIDTTLGLRDFYAQDDSLVSLKRNEGGFVTIVNELNDPSTRNTFSTDIVINSVRTVEADPEKGIDAPYVSINGIIFDFRKRALPVDLVVKNPAGMRYFENAEISNASPLFTKVWGKIVSTTVKTESQSEESAFGEAEVHTYIRKTKEWRVTGTSKVPYDFGDENFLTAEELTQAMQDRDVYLASIKKQSDEYRANKTISANPAMASNNTMSTPAGAFAKIGDFGF